MSESQWVSSDVFRALGDGGQFEIRAFHEGKEGSVPVIASIDLETSGDALLAFVIEKPCWFVLGPEFLAGVADMLRGIDAVMATDETEDQ